MSKDIERELLEKELGLHDVELETYISEPQTSDTSNDKKRKNKSDSKLDIYDTVQCVVSALVAGIMIFLFLFRVIGVDGDSMKATLLDGDRVIASGFLYEPKVGDIVILKSDHYDQPLVKRIIATENQTVDIDFTTGTVYVDGVVIDEPYIYEPTYVDEGFEGPVTVPEGCVFVMGDNRNDSNDSRFSEIGFIDEREIFGKVIWLLLPVDQNGEYDWSRVGSVY